MIRQFHIPTKHQDHLPVLFQIEGKPKFDFEKIIPQGRIELIFNFSEDKISAQIGNSSFSCPKVFINGFNAKPVKINLPEKQFFFGVVLCPKALINICATPPKDFASVVVDISLIDKEMNSLWEQLRELTSFKQRTELFFTWYNFKRCSKKNNELSFHDYLANHQANYSNVNEAAIDLGYSSRQLCRKLREHTGMNAEEFIRYKKYLKALSHIHSGKGNLMDIAHEANFYDQSHFSRVFKEFTGMSPSKYSKLQSHFPGHFYENVRLVQF